MSAPAGTPLRLSSIYHRHVRHHHRFNIAVVLTMIAVAWIVVPAVARFVDTMRAYDPGVYEPKDIQRGEWLANNGSRVLASVGWEAGLKLALIVVAAVAWLAVSVSVTGVRNPRRGSGSPPDRATGAERAGGGAPRR